MIKLENLVLPSPQQWMATIRGARNPLNSWDRMDSYIGDDGEFFMGEADHDLLMRLAEAGKDHRKFMRMIPVWIDITASLYWWKEADTYKVGTVANSCSTMHKIHTKEFTLDDFSHENLIGIFKAELENTVIKLNIARNTYIYGGEILDDNGEIINVEPKDKRVWEQMIQLLPSSYNQKRTVFLNYEVLSNMYHARKNHKLKEWREFCELIETLPYSELITCGGKTDIWYLCDREACGDKCPNVACMYTRDIAHAENFHADGDEYVEDLRIEIDL